jgi:hypothetical protein
VKIFAGLAGLLFAYSAVLQLNDPDPVRWFALYGTASVLAAASAFVPIPGVIFAGLACVAATWAATLVPEVLSLSSFTGTEEERELAGLLLVGLASVVLWSGGRPARGT